MNINFRAAFSFPEMTPKGISYIAKKIVLHPELGDKFASYLKMKVLNLHDPNHPNQFTIHVCLALFKTTTTMHKGLSVFLKMPPSVYVTIE